MAKALFRKQFLLFCCYSLLAWLPISIDEFFLLSSSLNIEKITITNLSGTFLMAKALFLMMAYIVWILPS